MVNKVEYKYENFTVFQAMVANRYNGPEIPEST